MNIFQPSALFAQQDMGTAFAAAGAVFVVFFLVMMALNLLIIVGLWKVFSKAGKPGWAALIPVYNLIVLLEIVKRPLWWVVLAMIPMVNLAVSIVLCLDLAKQFNKGPGFGIGLALLPYVFVPMLGFGSAEYADAVEAGMTPTGGSTPQAQPVRTAEAAEPDAEDADLQRRFVLFQAVPAWMISMVVHVLILLALALVTIGVEEKVVNVLSASSIGEEGPEIDEFSMEQPQEEMEQTEEEVTEEVVEVAEPIEDMQPLDLDTPLEMVSVPISVVDMASAMAPVADSLQTLSATTTSELGSRSSADVKKQMLRTYGGTESSEAAVTKALKWLERHQLPNGAWTFAHQVVCRDPACDHSGSHKEAVNGATALALLPFLGAGQTQFTGEHKKTVERGLAFLIANGKPKSIGGLQCLDFTEKGGSMYSHGLAAIALCEAYAMTEDSRLAGPAQGALNFIMYAQDPRGGGWRYRPRQAGDTSATGWQIMALKSGYMGHLTVTPASIRGSTLFLDSVQSDGGSLYGYTAPVANRRSGRACHAVGLLCRMYLGWDKDHPGIKKGVQHLSAIGVAKGDIYYNYYAAQVLRQYGGSEWEKFNTELRDWLVAEQSDTGGTKGSWAFKNAGHGTEHGGRLYMTCMATMILEVYYRHMPLYADKAAEEEFPL
ncbi:DUF5684 domain-containing protein [Roseimaritima ulvae]|uniref:Squalene cyclase C-terminal domain-containing protein n=1 Tax=Roseimaritima ulvae TaxID=980254 RepID=A0A5B9QTT0_9BACT|nr:DUF5684 domain-containing protein [Roseimaritima ulvae]QEG42428.1 hypothetical protein UC8_44670 [Roseimaritima ulvae]